MYSKVIKFIAMKRSGHHAIILWMAEHLPFNVYFINNYGEELMANPKKNHKKLAQRLLRPLNEIKKSRKNILFFNLEDYDHQTQAHINPSDKEVSQTIYVHRSAPNLFTSRLKVGLRIPKPHWYGKSAFKLFNSQIQMCLEDPSIFTISFDKWVSSEKYRKSLGESLKLKGSFHLPYKKVSSYGGGSSFKNFDPNNSNTLLNRKVTLSKDKQSEIDNNTLSPKIFHHLWECL